MILYRLMWIFGGSFGAFGLLMAAVDGVAARNTWGGLSLASLGAFAFAMALDGISKGKIRLQFNVIERARQPRLFWAIVVMIMGTGTVVIMSAVWAMFFKEV
jgi:hypothetical protein